MSDEQISLNLQEYAILTHLILAPGPKGRIYNRREWYLYNLCRFELCEMDCRYARATPTASKRLAWEIMVTYPSDQIPKLLELGVLTRSYKGWYDINKPLVYDLWLKGKLP